MKHAKQRDLYCVILCQTTHGTKRPQKDKSKNVSDKARLMREVRQGNGGEGGGR